MSPSELDDSELRRTLGHLPRLSLDADELAEGLRSWFAGATDPLSRTTTALLAVLALLEGIERDDGPEAAAVAETLVWSGWSLGAAELLATVRALSSP